MSDTIILAERIAKLEAKYEHISEKMDDVSDKVDSMYEILAGTKTAKWIFLGLLSVAGFVILNIKDVVGLFK